MCWQVEEQREDFQRRLVMFALQILVGTRCSCFWKAVSIGSLFELVSCSLIGLCPSLTLKLKWTDYISVVLIYYFLFVHSDRDSIAGHHWGKDCESRMGSSSFGDGACCAAVPLRLFNMSVAHKKPD